MTAPATRGHVLHTAAGYDLLVWLLLLGREGPFRDRIIRLARVRENESVLDVGCGTGSLAIAAKRRVGVSGAVDGIDASPEMIARAVKKARSAGVDVGFKTGVAEALPYPDAAFDVVLSTLMMHHLPRDIRGQCVLEMRRVLRPGGRLLAVDFGAIAAERRGLLAHFHRHGGVTKDAIMALLTEAGLETLESGGVGMRNVNYVLARK